MSALLVADIHIGDHAWCRGTVQAGVSDRAREGLDALAAAAALARELELDALVLLGDVFDTSRPAPWLIARVQEILTYQGQRDVVSVVLVGNHDQESEAPGHHACAALGSETVVVVDEVAVVSAGNLEVFLVAPRASRPPVAGTVERLRSLGRPSTPGTRCRVVGLHVGLADVGTPVHLRESNDAMLVSAAAHEVATIVGAQVVVAGNWHWPQHWHVQTEQGVVQVVQVGTLAPHDFRDAGQRGWAVEVRDDGTVVRHEIPGPRFAKFANEDALRAVYPSGLPPHHYAAVETSEQVWLGERVRVTARQEASERAPDPTPDIDDIEQTITAWVQREAPAEVADAAVDLALETWRGH